MAFSNTPINPVTGAADQRTDSFTLPAMSSLDLATLNVSFDNNGGQPININKVWISLKVTLPTYTSITLAGNTALTAVNTYFGVDFSDKYNHNTLVLRDGSTAYLYGVAVDTSSQKQPSSFEARQPAFVTVEKTIKSVASSKNGVSDTTGESISDVTAKDSLYYVIPRLGTLSLTDFNTTGLSGPISAASLVIDYAALVYSGTNYVQWSVNGQPLSNTGIQVVQRPIEVAPEFNLYSMGAKNVDDINSLVVQTTNNGGLTQEVSVNCIWVNITLSPTVYIYRWANLTVTDTQDLPVNNATVSSTLMDGIGETHTITHQMV